MFLVHCVTRLRGKERNTSMNQEGWCRKWKWRWNSKNLKRIWRYLSKKKKRRDLKLQLWYASVWQLHLTVWEWSEKAYDASVPTTMSLLETPAISTQKTQYWWMREGRILFEKQLCDKDIPQAQRKSWRRLSLWRSGRTRGPIDSEVIVQGSSRGWKDHPFI